MTLTTARTLVSLSALAAAAILGGCADSRLPPVGANDHFEADDAPRRIDHVFAQQAAVAAREDGTLYARHFTDGTLNSLGYQKLSSMAYGPAGGKLTVYLDLPESMDYNVASENVRKTLARGGIADKDFTLVRGPNPDVGSPAAAGLAGLARQSKLTGTSSPDAATNAGAAAGRP